MCLASWFFLNIYFPPSAKVFLALKEKKPFKDGTKLPNSKPTHFFHKKKNPQNFNIMEIYIFQCVISNLMKNYSSCGLRQ